MIKDITTYIHNGVSFFTIGTNIFAGYIPSDKTGDAVVCIDSGGKPTAYLPDYLEKTVQVISRATDYHVAMTNALKVYNYLHGKRGITLPQTGSQEYYVNVIEAISSPQSLGQDEKGFFIISTNYVLRLQNS